MSYITVNEEKCVKCGLCVKECPVYVLKMGENGPLENPIATCNACGHCVAVCPNTAIDNEKAPLAQQVDVKDIPKLNEQQAEYFLRSRRAIRNYQDKPVSRELLLKLVDIARMAPTASNSQDISFIVVENKLLLEKATEITIQMLENSPFKVQLKNTINSYRDDGVDSIFHGAPNLIIATANKDFPHGRNNAISCLTYLELYAPSLGLGSFWAGMFEHCASAEGSPLLELFNISEEKKVVGAVMVGYPKYRYRRLVDRNPLDVTFID
ncbi:nitroreductase family protein [Desulfosporosinus lacus]|uniref:Nitroreductase n=1 Tax=Desulfosporosinus lacus DSM 15449 TaxID=1121420 RepID=A0A1M5ZUG4_9FIRM|nr:nitroreductase family protein [Desulfosporosinus lacus]SHI27852.1 Nitroreductase [Desulfosporosinus lacus DSM 15449]